MPEATTNIEFAHKVLEKGHHGAPSERRAAWVEIVEVTVIAIVALATAWSGYQAARWGALSAKNYALATRTSVRGQVRATLAGQDRLYDIVTFNGWIAAYTAGNKKLAALYERRFRTEYKIAFAAWQKLDPFNNDSAPPGPIFMAEYANANTQMSEKLVDEAREYFEKGVSSRETGDNYVKVTVFLATVLLLTALSQRVKIVGPRIALLAVASILLLISSYWILILPRA